MEFLESIAMSLVSKSPHNKEWEYIDVLREHPRFDCYSTVQIVSSVRSAIKAVSALEFKKDLPPVTMLDAIDEIRPFETEPAQIRPLGLKPQVYVLPASKEQIQRAKIAANGGVGNSVSTGKTSNKRDKKTVMTPEQRRAADQNRSEQQKRRGLRSDDSKRGWGRGNHKSRRS